MTTFTAKLGGLITLAGFLLAPHSAQAHLTYGGRDFGAFSGLTNGAMTITNQTVTGNYGWADAADGVLGDSHRGRAFRFRLDNAAFVNLTVSANPKATATSLGGFTPAFSIYAGLGAVAPLPASQTTNPPSADHDFGEASSAWRTWWVQQNLNPLATNPDATDGSWNALGEWKIGGDGDLPGDFSQLTTFTYKGSASTTASGGTVSGSFLLPAGDYTIMIGGNDLANKTAGTALSAHGIAARLTVSSSPMATIAQKVFLARPAGAPTNWVLQSTLSAGSGTWSNVTNPPVVVDGASGVVLESGQATRYFRYNYVP